jgi:hypothetical protein
MTRLAYPWAFLRHSKIAVPLTPCKFCLSITQATLAGSTEKMIDGTDEKAFPISPIPKEFF